MSEPKPSGDEQRAAVRYAVLAGTYRGLALAQRLPELMRRRGWPAADDDLRCVLAGAVACKAIGAGRTVFRRPTGAGALGGAWPQGNAALPASMIVAWLELDELLVQQ